MIICGIDPGLKGGISLIDDQGNLIAIDKMPTDQTIDGKRKLHTKNISILLKAASVIIVEKSEYIPVKGKSGQGKVSIFNYGKEYGRLLGVIEMLGIKYHEVRSFVWKKYFSISKDKKEAINLAAIKNGSYDDFIPEYCRVPHDGMCESYLIALYGLGNNIKG
jgi:crossover junction endodeoxyribonuclease RuvC